MLGGQEELGARLARLEGDLERLLSAPVLRFDERCRSSLPEDHGIYRIFDPLRPHVTVRAGRTKTAAGGLRQRVYQNHLMGDQRGNLCPQLVRAGLCSDLGAAKQYVRSTLALHYLVVHDPDERTWLEYFM
ncbi:MAG: hypothetical protein WC709_04410 [Thermoleophilia bacterium]